ncbi:MAG TPA: response regulator [Longimicrobiales bacterium]|nr:response regulator [Longimicrobiales bacterium]
MKILVADDDPMARALLEQLLRAWGHEVTAVQDGRAALAALTSPEGPGLALLDWEMPELDGPTVCTHLRGDGGNGRPLYLILLTGRSGPGDIARGLDAGADDYVGKPFHPAELRARIQAGVRLLSVHDALQERERFQGALELAGAVCHEFNQPLQVIRGWCDLLLEEGPESGVDAHALRGITESVERLGELTRKLMGLTRYRAKEYMDGRSRIIDLAEAARPGLHAGG